MIFSIVCHVYSQVDVLNILDFLYKKYLLFLNKLIQRGGKTFRRPRWGLLMHDPIGQGTANPGGRYRLGLNWSTGSILVESLTWQQQPSGGSISPLF